MVAEAVQEGREKIISDSRGTHPPLFLTPISGLSIPCGHRSGRDSILVIFYCSVTRGLVRTCGEKDTSLGYDEEKLLCEI